MTFRPDQKVICVDAALTERSLNGALTEGAIYIVRDIGPTTAGKPGLKVHGYEYSTGHGQVGEKTGRPFVDNFLCCDRFRPLVERKTDIACLKALLVPGAKIREGA